MRFNEIESTPPLKLNTIVSMTTSIAVTIVFFRQTKGSPRLYACVERK